MSTEVKPTDWDAEDNMWEPTASGGSSLPSYTSADKGKVLTIGDASPVETEVVVVPEQSVTYEGDAVLLSNAEGVASLDDGTSVVLFVNGQRYEATFSNYDIRVEFETNKFYHVYNGKGTSVYFEAYDTAVPGHEGDTTPIDGTYTISLSAVQSVTPSVTTVIVPEQTVNFVNGTASLSNVPITVDDLTAGDTATLHFSNGVQSFEYEMTVVDDEGYLYYEYKSDVAYYQIYHYTDGWMCYAEGIESTPLSGEYTISLVKTVTPVEPKWEAAGVVYTLSQSAGTALMTGIQSAVTTAATDGLAEANVTTGFDSDDVAMIEKMADDLSSGSPFVLQINGMDNTFSPVISSKTSTIGTKYVTFNIPLYRVANMFFNIIITLNASDTLFSTISVIKLAST